MTFRPSRWVATAGFLLLVPLAIWLGYAGESAGLYPSFFVPVVVGVVLVAGLVILFAVLPLLRRWERHSEGDAVSGRRE